MTTTANLGIELLATGQAQPEVTINEAVVALDAAAGGAQVAAAAAAAAADEALLWALLA